MLTIGMFPRDQLLCDKCKLQCNESSFVGLIISISVYKQINQNKVMFESSQDAKHNIFFFSREIAGLLETFLS